MNHFLDVPRLSLDRSLSLLLFGSASNELSFFGNLLLLPSLLVLVVLGLAVEEVHERDIIDYAVSVVDEDKLLLAVVQDFVTASSGLV